MSNFIIKKNVTCLLCNKLYDVDLKHKSFDYCPKCQEILQKLAKMYENNAINSKKS